MKIVIKYLFTHLSVNLCRKNGGRCVSSCSGTQLSYSGCSSGQVCCRPQGNFNFNITPKLTYLQTLFNKFSELLRKIWWTVCVLLQGNSIAIFRLFLRTSLLPANDRYLRADFNTKLTYTYTLFFNYFSESMLPKWWRMCIPLLRNKYALLLRLFQGTSLLQKPFHWH